MRVNNISTSPRDATCKINMLLENGGREEYCKETELYFFPSKEKQTK